MKRKIQRILSCLVTFLLITGLVYRLGRLVRPVDTDIAFNVIESFHELPPDSVEVIGYGSSIMWRGLDVMELYEKYGIGAYNYGCNWQHINTTSLFLQDSLRTQSPKVAVIETFLAGRVLEDTDITGEIYYTRGIPDFEGKQEYLKQCFGNDKERYLSYYMPLCAFHDNWVNLSEQSFSDDVDGSYFQSTMGYLPLTEVTPVTLWDPATFQQIPLDEEAVAALDEIVRICRENQVEILFYTSPRHGEDVFCNAMKEYASEHGYYYLNLHEKVEEIGIDSETDFSDENHLNDKGAAKVADYLGVFIVNHYDVTDMRTIEDNLWESKIKSGKE